MQIHTHEDSCLFSINPYQTSNIHTHGRSALYVLWGVHTLNPQPYKRYNFLYIFVLYLIYSFGFTKNLFPFRVLAYKSSCPSTKLVYQVNLITMQYLSSNQKILSKSFGVWVTISNNYYFHMELGWCVAMLAMKQECNNRYSHTYTCTHRHYVCIVHASVIT